jgi:hypothetical protein
MNPIEQIADERDKLKAKLSQAKAKLRLAKSRMDALAAVRYHALQTVERVNTANVRDRAMLCDAAGIPHDADILEWISGVRERIERMKRAGDDLRVCCESVVPQSDVVKYVKRWTEAKEAKP